MATKKSLPDWPLRSPITFRPSSTDERPPRPESAPDRHAEELFHRLVEEKSRKLGLTRRQFIGSSCGAATALLVINQVYGCSNNGTGYDVNDASTLDAGEACEKLAGDEFIFDVQTHHVNPKGKWLELDPGAKEGYIHWPQAQCADVAEPIDCLDARHYVREVFIHSETSVAILSGVPAFPETDPLTNAERVATRELVNTLAHSDRLFLHANVVPQLGAAQLDAMQRFAEEHRHVSAWKVYPSFGEWQLDDDTVGRPFLEKARAVDVKRIAAHRGLSGDAGGYRDDSSPRDLVYAAKANPDITFIAYHSGYEGNHVEGPYDAADPRGVDRLIKALEETGLGNDGNVYAELGSTWRAVMTSPQESAHLMGKLLKYLGEDRILWGTDCIWYGSPQEQILAFRAMSYSDSFRGQFGYPALTADAKRKIFGLNACRVYGIDPAATRCKIRSDDLAKARLAALHDVHHGRGPAIVPPSYPHYGPRTRRAFFELLRGRG